MTQSFSDLGLPQIILDGLVKHGFEIPTKIQAEAIPHQLKGRDILGIAQTGSGKTAAFGLPILAAISQMTGTSRPMTARALILAPTRELAVQIDENLRQMAGSMRLSTVLVLGGVSRFHQVQRLARGVDICIATPGRLKDLLDDKKFKLNETKFLVLDEADRMLDMGFIGPVREIAGQMSHRRQTALFSATMAPEVAKLAASLLNDPVRVEAQPPATTVAEIEQRVILAGSKAKRGELNTLLADPALERVLIFARTKHGADRVAKNLAIDGHQAAAIHGNKSQNARQAALKGFATGNVRLLVATDIASRGIDVPGITHVINYELPDDAENYVHRIGRTGRNGASGVAITLCDGTEQPKLRDIEKLIRKKLPVSGDLKVANQTGVQAAPAGAEERPQRQAPRPAQNRARPGKPAGKASHGRGPGAARPPKADGSSWWEQQAAGTYDPAKPKAAKTAKPRWSKGQKDARGGRRPNRSGRSESVA